MARYSAVGTAAAGTAALPFGALNAAADAGLTVREIGVWSIGTVAARVGVFRSTTAHTGTALIEKEFGGGILGQPVSAVALKSVTVAGTIEADAMTAGGIGAAAGSGFILTFYGENNGLVIPEGVANGIVLMEFVDTANTYDFYIVWDE